MHLRPAPSYEEVITKFNLEILLSPGDLVIESGDIALTKSGDLMLNNVHYNAVRRFASAWRFNAPMPNALFELNVAVTSRSTALKENLNQVFEDPKDLHLRSIHSSAALSRRLALNEEIAANVLGSESCAGAILLNLNGLLLALKDHINVPRGSWENSGPLIYGYSVGAILVAVSNYFRHWDEWRKTRPPSSRQATSMDVLNSVLLSAGLKKSDHQLLGVEGICTKILDILSEGDFETLSARVFAFANGLEPGP